jgi:hypothetical protein
LKNNLLQVALYVKYTSADLYEHYTFNKTRYKLILYGIHRTAITGGY